MSELFLNNGHLSSDGLRDLVAGRCNEMQRLEAAEHLSFCDECLVRYTNLLTEDVLQQPEENLTLPVMRRLRQKAGKVLLNRYTAAAAAVAIAGALWNSGVMGDVNEIINQQPVVQPPVVQPPVVTQPAPQAPQNPITGAVNAWLGDTVSALRPAPQPQESPEPEPEKPTGNEEDTPKKAGFLSGLFHKN